MIFITRFQNEENTLLYSIVINTKWSSNILVFLNSLPNPNQETVSIRKVEGGIAAVEKFSGKPTEAIVCQKEKALRSCLVKDGLKPKMGCLLARYNDPGRTWRFIMVWHCSKLFRVCFNYFLSSPQSYLFSWNLRSDLTKLIIN